MKPKPAWTIYKQDYVLGGAITWHKALDILVKQEGLTNFTVIMYKQILSIYSGENHYQIIQGG